MIAMNYGLLSVKILEAWMKLLGKFYFTITIVISFAAWPRPPCTDLQQHERVVDRIYID